MPKSSEVYEKRLVEIGRITTTWAKFEHWIDQAIWILAGVDPRKGACITSQVNSIHGKFRALIAVMREAGRPDDALAAARKLSNDAASVVNVRNLFAHGSLDLGIDLDSRTFEVYLRRVGTKGELTFETTLLSEEELSEGYRKVSAIYQSLLNQWPLIVGRSSIDELAPPHE